MATIYKFIEESNHKEGEEKQLKAPKASIVSKFQRAAHKAAALKLF